MAAPSPVALDYGQPPLPKQRAGWAINSIDMQVVTRFDSWNQDFAHRTLEFSEILKTGANTVALAVPYDNPTKYTTYCTEAHALGLRVWHRSHWNLWEGDNSFNDSALVLIVTASGQTVTVTLQDHNSNAVGHNLNTNDKVIISGATQTEFNGLFAVTVVSSSVFTYHLSTNPTTNNPSGSIRVRMDQDTYRNKVYDFIVANPTCFAKDDMFAMCPESNAGDDHYNYTFRAGQVVGGSFDINLYNAFQISQVTYANAAFKAIGLYDTTNNHTLVHTWPISQQISLLDLQGRGTINGDTGRTGGLKGADIVTYFAGRLCTDLYENTSIRNGDDYFMYLNQDLSKFPQIFPECVPTTANPDYGYFQGEIGYHTTVSVSDGEQWGVVEAINRALRINPYVIGVSWFVHYGSTTNSLWLDTETPGTIIRGGRPAVHAITEAFNSGNARYGWRPKA